jgi:hypothetical protein
MKIIDIYLLKEGFEIPDDYEQQQNIEEDIY